MDATRLPAEAPARETRAFDTGFVDGRPSVEVVALLARLASVAGRGRAPDTRVLPVQ